MQSSSGPANRLSADHDIVQLAYTLANEQDLRLRQLGAAGLVENLRRSQAVMNQARTALADLRDLSRQMAAVADHLLAELPKENES